MAISEAKAKAAEEQVLKAVRDSLDALGLEEDDCGPLTLSVGIDCIVSVADAYEAPSQVLMGAVSALLNLAIGKGWLPPVPPGAQVVLILDSGGGAAVDTVLH